MLVCRISCGAIAALIAAMSGTALSPALAMSQGVKTDSGIVQRQSLRSRLGGLQVNHRLAQTLSQSSSQRVTVVDGKLSLMIPDGFTAMTDAEISLKFPGSSPPSHAYGDERRKVAIAIALSEAQLTNDQLGEFREFLSSILERGIPGFRWIKEDWITLSSQRWVKFEFFSQAVDTEIHNDLYFTSLDGRMLGVNLNATVDTPDSVWQQLLASRDSIQLNPTSGQE